MEHEHAASLTARAVKKALPERAIVTKDARTTINSAASMFTLYLTAAAQDHSAQHKRQTITLSDVLQALKDVDLEHFVSPIEDCLAEAKVVAAKKKARKEADGVADQEEANAEEEQDEEPLADAVATDEDVVEEEDEAMESAEEEPPLPQEQEESAAMSDGERETATEDEQEETIELEEDRIDDGEDSAA